MTALAPAVRRPVTVNRRMLAAGTFALLGLVDVFVFGLLAANGDATFALSLPGASLQVPDLRIPAAPTAYAAGVLSLAIAVYRATVEPRPRAKRAAIAAVLFLFVLSLLCWGDAGNPIPLNMINLLQGTLTASIPLILGALAGCVCERSGVINIAIEGQLLLGAFTAAVVASAVGVLWLGL
ncbi:MAG TPA: ABC transporter permease, partial [Streptosporangiaceae bacterium]